MAGEAEKPSTGATVGRQVAKASKSRGSSLPPELAAHYAAVAEAHKLPNGEERDAKLAELHEKLKGKAAGAAEAHDDEDFTQEDVNRIGSQLRNSGALDDEEIDSGATNPVEKSTLQVKADAAVRELDDAFKKKRSPQSQRFAVKKAKELIAALPADQQLNYPQALRSPGMKTKPVFTPEERAAELAKLRPLGKTLPKKIDATTPDTVPESKKEPVADKVAEKLAVAPVEKPVAATAQKATDKPVAAPVRVDKRPTAAESLAKQRAKDTEKRKAKEPVKVKGEPKAVTVASLAKNSAADRDTLKLLAENQPEGSDARDALETALHNTTGADYDPLTHSGNEGIDRRINTVERLAAVWRYFQDKPAPAKAILDAIQLFGGRLHGPAAGENVPYDGRYHGDHREQGPPGVFAGDPVTITQQPVVLDTDLGTHVALKGKVRPVKKG